MSNIVPANTNVKQLATFLENDKVRQRVQAILPKGLSAEKLIYQALTLANQNPKIAECSHASVYAGIIQAADLELELSGPLGQAYLVPRPVKSQWVAVFQVGYRGLLSLAYRSGKVSNFQLRKVKHGDRFEYSFGMYPSLSHEEPKWGTVYESEAEYEQAQKVVGYYAVVNYIDGGKDFEVLSLAEAMEHRKRFASTKSGGPWYDMSHGFHEMALKTAARRLCKRSPVSVKLVTAAVVDEYGEQGVIDHTLLPRTSDRTGELAAELIPPPDGGWQTIEAETAT